MRVTAKHHTAYIPFEVWKESTPVRILSRLYYLDHWVTAAELWDALDLPTWDGKKNPERNRYQQMLGRLVKSGQVACKRLIGFDIRGRYYANHYRLTKRKRVKYPRVRV